MEYVEGTTLAAMIGRGPLDLDVILDIVEQIADALTEAERVGVVHRDLKPANVMVTPDGRVKVLDFGVAQRRVAAATEPDDPTRTGGPARADLRRRRHGAVRVARAAHRTAVDGRADLFSLGVMLYELVCGRRPFGGANAAQFLEETS